MTRPLQKRDFVLTDMLRYSDSWLQLGEVIGDLEDENNDVTILWYNGSINGLILNVQIVITQTPQV